MLSQMILKGGWIFKFIQFNLIEKYENIYLEIREI